MQFIRFYSEPPVKSVTADIIKSNNSNQQLHVDLVPRLPTVTVLQTDKK